MELAQAQYGRIDPVLPKHRGNVVLSTLSVLNVILYVVEQGCKGRGQPAHFGNGRTISTRRNRWAKKGVLDQLSAELQRLEIIRGKIDVRLLSRTVVTVHSDGTGALERHSAQALGKSRGGWAPSFIGSPPWRIEAPWGSSCPEGSGLLGTENSDTFNCGIVKVSASRRLAAGGGGDGQDRNTAGRGRRGAVSPPVPLRPLPREWLP